MRKFLVIAALVYLGYGYFTGTWSLPWGSSSSPVISTQNQNSQLTANRSAPAQTFSCDGRQHCSQMRSYEEARFFIRNCPNTKMDGDGDGIPCEKQFGR